MRRLLTGWIVVALVAGIVGVATSGGSDEPVRYLPRVLPLGYRLQDARLADAGHTLAHPLTRRYAILRRPSTRVYASYVGGPGTAEPIAGMQRHDFPDGVAAVGHAPTGTTVWWTTTHRSGTLESSDVEDDGLLAIARHQATHGFTAPPGYRAGRGFDADSAVEWLHFAGDGETDALRIDVHRGRRALPERYWGETAVQRQDGDDVITVIGRSEHLTRADLRAVARSVVRVPASTWRRVLAAADLDPRPEHWDRVSGGRSSIGAGWALAVRVRAGERCLAVFVVDRNLGVQALCDVARWHTDPIVAVPTTRSGPVDVDLRGRRLHPIADVRVDGRRIVVVDVPADLLGQVIDPVEVVSRR